MFAGFARRDQRAKGQLYCVVAHRWRAQVVAADAARLGANHQELQPLVTTSSWEHTDVRARLTGWAARFVDPDASVVDDTGFPEDGTASPGVARMYRGALGKRGNCQIGVSAHAATDLGIGSDAVQATTRRSRRAIPDEARFREKWCLV
jgi:SRSO17 transposase